VLTWYVVTEYSHTGHVVASFYQADRYAFWYTQSMTIPMTTIKVTPATRDRIKGHAQRADRTINDYLDVLIDLADRELRFDALRAAIAATSEEDMTSWREETEMWETAELTDARDA